MKRDFVAQHYLIGGDWGPENELHSHHYRVELQLQGERLDQHGYLVDIVEIEKRLDEQVGYFRDRTLNDLPEFGQQAPGNGPLNPSIEHFSRILCHALSQQISAPNIITVRVKIWENEIAWASYSQQREG